MNKILIVISLLLIGCSDQSRYNSNYMLYLQEIELERQSCKYQLYQEVESYITSVAPTSNLNALALINACDSYNVDLRLVLAQGQTESHFGTVGIAAKTNSIWNVGAYDSLSSKEINRRYIYSNVNKSIEPYLKLLTKSYLVNKTERQLLQRFVSISGARYASNPLYEQELTYTWNKITSNTDIDSLQSRFNYLTNELYP